MNSIYLLTKKHLSAVSIAILFCSSLAFGQQKQPKTSWSLNPFDNHVFVENKGQVESDVTTQTAYPVLYIVRLGRINAYFTTHGVVYRELVYPEKNKGESEEDEEENRQAPAIKYLSYEWKNSNANVTIEAGQQQSYYSSTGGSTTVPVISNVFKKIVYKNIYPGIDIEYTFLKGKDGIKYSVIVHPGADPSQVKLVYKGAKSLKVDASGNATVKSNIGIFTDHAITCYTQGGSNNVSTTYNINGKEESFSITGDYDKTKTLVIDPWTTNPLFTGWVDAGYDVDYDNAGNIYVYGSYGPVAVAKLNSAGTVQWICTAPTSGIYSPFCFEYGGFCVDRSTGDCFISEGPSAGGLAAPVKTLKINTSGTIVAQNKCDSINEVWKETYDQCNHHIIIAGGGAYSPKQAAIIDGPTMTIVTQGVSVLGAVTTSVIAGKTTYFHDLFGVTMDPAGGNCYMGSTRSNVNSSTADDLMLMKVSLPALGTAYKNYLNGFPSTTYPYALHEGYINAYSPDSTSVGNPNSFSNSVNGLAAGYQSWVYMSDGTTLTQYLKSTGAVVKTSTIYTWPFLNSKDSIRWGGIDVDPCEVIYVGQQDSINVYNSTLTRTKQIKVPSRVYGIKVGPVIGKTGTEYLYACGLHYVTCMIVPTKDSVTLTITKSNANKCKCDGSATAHFLMTCGDTSHITYQWSNGQTTQTATNLCPGTYTCTVSLGNCASTYQDTVNITAPPGSLSLSKTLTDIKCHGGANGSATVTVTSGTGPYTYSWSPSGGTVSSPTGMSAGTYTCTVNDASGCSDTVIVTITEPPLLKATPTSTNATCGNSNGTVSVTATGGTGAYTYSWSPGGLTNTSATNMSAGTYWVTVTDVNGCTDSASTTVTATPNVTGNINPIKNVLCNAGNTGSATENASSGTAPYTYAWSNGQTTSTATNLSVGTYYVTVTDKNGCITKDTAIIRQPTKVNAAFGWLYTVINPGVVETAEHPAEEVTLRLTLYTPGLS